MPVNHHKHAAISHQFFQAGNGFLGDIEASFVLRKQIVQYHYVCVLEH